MKDARSFSSDCPLHISQALPYPLATPSWVIPGTYAENLRFLEDKRDITAVELLFFIYNEEVHKELKADWERILQYRNRFFYTAHLPDMLEEHHEKLVEQLAPLVEHFVVHPPSGEKEQEALAQLLVTWEERYKRPRGYRFIIENTQDSRMERLLEKLPGWGLCLDTGHLQCAGDDIGVFLSTYGTQIQEIHLHGVVSSGLSSPNRLVDHHPLKEDDLWFTPLLYFLFSRERPLLHQSTQDKGRGSLIKIDPDTPSFSPFRANLLINLELFSWQEVAQSLVVWKGWCMDFFKKGSLYEQQ